MNRKLVKVGSCLSILAAILVVNGFIPSANAGIVGSAHDFTADAWSGGEICLPCHTPHGGNKAITDAPLWNHTVTTATYTVYTSATMNAVVGQVDGVSKLCSSCHDGTVALDSFSHVTGTTFMSTTPRTDKRSSHPISFTYDTALATADGTLWDPSTHLTVNGKTIDQDLLRSGKVQCTSCHDVHGRYGFDNFLRIDNHGSGLCLTCHNK